MADPAADGGFVFLYRSLMDHHVFRNQAEAMTFAWMILRATWKPYTMRYKGRSVPLKRGQLVMSVRDLAEAMDRDKAWIERLCARLKRETMIETSNETGVNVITICNYNIYQPFTGSGETVGETADETRVRQSRDTEERKEELEEEDSSEAKASSEREACEVIAAFARAFHLPAKRKGRRKPRVDEPFVRPADIPADAWDGFEEMRRRKRAFLTDRARHGIVKKLRRFAEHGHPPGDVLDQSTMNSWTDVYEIKDQRNGTGTGHHRNDIYADRMRDPVLGDLARELDPRMAAAGSG